MPPLVRVDVTGLQEAIGVLDPVRVNRALKAAFQEIGIEGLKTWRKATPRRTGRLRRSLTVRRLEPLGRSFQRRPAGFYYAPVNAGPRGGMTRALEGFLRGPVPAGLYRGTYAPHWERNDQGTDCTLDEAERVPEKVNVLATKAEPTATETTELTSLRGKLTDIEPEIRTQLAKEEGLPGEPLEDRTLTQEDRERRELRSKTGLAHFIGSAVNGTPLPSEAAEFAAACGVGGGQAPLELMLPVETRERETRDVTPGVIAPGATAPIAPVLFARTAAASLGVTFPSVPVGQAQFPVMTTAPTAGVVAKDASAASTAGYSAWTRASLCV